MKSNKLVHNFLSALLRFSGKMKPITENGIFCPFENKKGLFWTKSGHRKGKTETNNHENLNPEAIVFVYPENFLPNIQDMICEATTEGCCDITENINGQNRKKYYFGAGNNFDNFYTILEYKKSMNVAHYYVKTQQHDNIFYEIKPTEATLKKLKEFEDYKDE
eukprot:GHVP01022407.1.p1 GENE.GHVP01022407.1~~GHVP01022407.1.p1  ORF type:complete len:163 (+),score=24.93 GHVP01022407.1:575-1063(+)